MIPASRIEALAQAAFAAFVRTTNPHATVPAWSVLSSATREAWRAAARSVAEAVQVSP